MSHEIYTVLDFEIIEPYTLRIKFDDQSEQVINFLPLLRGELYGPLRDPTLFKRARHDAEAGTLVWPNNADFDPAILHDWDKVGEAMLAMAQTWADAPVKAIRPQTKAAKKVKSKAVREKKVAHSTKAKARKPQRMTRRLAAAR